MSFCNLTSRQNVKVFVSMLIHVTVKNNLKDRIICWANAALVSLIVELICTPPTLQTLSNSPAYSVILSTETFLDHFFFLIMFEKLRIVSLESFRFISIASTVLSNKFWWTIKHFKPVSILANLSTYARSLHQVLFLNQANAFFFFEFTRFENKKCIALFWIQKSSHFWYW